MRTPTRGTTEQRARELNGWNLDDFQATVETVKEQPQAGVVRWRVGTEWDEGFALDAHTQAIGQMETTIRRAFTIRSDHPPELLGEDSGPTAVEMLLCALGACVTGTYAAHATAKGIRLDALRVDVSADIDLNGFLQLKPTRAGLRNVRVSVAVKSGAADADLDGLLEITRRASPVYDTVSDAVAIDAAVIRA
jgi:uncharacterized OsmC-like protein